MILSESKVYSKNKYEKNDETIDFLSLKYDINSIKKPYSLRVIVSIVIKLFLEDNALLLVNTEEEIKQLNNNIIKLKNKYNINPKEIFSIIMQESVNQSITSEAGNNYEDRIERTLIKYNYNVEGQRHDDRHAAVEYDFIFNINKFLIGVSAKRTLRERYKQNHRSVSDLGVDKMLIITLGTDLNEAKIDNILSLQGQYILVASEIYDTNEYMQECPRVYSSGNLEELFKVLGKKGY